MLSKITKLLLFSVVTITPFLITTSLYFPYVSGKVYIFRLLVMLAFFFWVWLILKEKKYPLTSFGASRPNFKNLLVVAIVLFFLAQVLVSFFGVDPALSFFSGVERGEGVLQYGFWVLYFLMLISVLRSKKDWQIFLATFLTVAFLISIYSWFNYQKQPSLYGFFGNPAYFGGFLIFAISFAVIFLQERLSFLGNKLFYSKTLFSFLILFFVISLIFTQIRGAYAGLAAGFGLFTILSLLFLRKEKKKLIICLSSILMIGLISVGLIFAYKESQFVKNYRLLRRIAEIGRPLETSSGKERLLTWEIALKAFKDRPIFGWGSENFQAAFNKYYNYKIGLEEPWFDQVHNQSLQYLVDGGILLFLLYLFWLFSIFYLIFRIFKKKKLLAAILASTFLAYIIQGLFLFDVFPIYLGLFIFLAFVYFEYKSVYGLEVSSPLAKNRNKEKLKLNRYLNKIIIITAFFLVCFLLLTTVWLPYKGNYFVLKYHAYLIGGKYKEAQLFLEQAVAIKSPYDFLSIRKRAGWSFLAVLDNGKEENLKGRIKLLTNLYKFITSEMEKGVKEYPFDAQIYYVLGKTYRLGFEKLGQDDLDKGERILKKALNYSQYRIEYLNELAQILILKGKSEEAENLVQGYVKNIENTNPDDPFPYFTLGNLYFVEEKYDLAMPQYQKAEEKSYKFWQNSIAYNRYLQTAEKLEDYQKIVEMCQEYLDNLGPDADTLFNMAIGYRGLKNNQKAKEFFLKALELNSELEKYRSFFAP